MKSIGNKLFSESHFPAQPECIEVCDDVWDNVGFLIRQSIVESVRDIAYEVG